MNKNIETEEFGPPVTFESYKRFLFRKFSQGFSWGFGWSLFITAQYAIFRYAVQLGMLYNHELVILPLFWSTATGIGFGIFWILRGQFRTPDQTNPNEIEELESNKNIE